MPLILFADGSVAIETAAEEGQESERFELTLAELEEMLIRAIKADTGTPVTPEEAEKEKINAAYREGQERFKERAVEACVYMVDKQKVTETPIHRAMI